MVNEKCHVFTPIHIVNKMLDEVGYISDLYGKSFLENSCGEGNILCEAIRRYISECVRNKIDIINIRNGLERDFVGIEFDENNYKKCINNLNLIVNEFGINNVNWDIINEDFLKINLNNHFDFIVGNPPYISYADIDDNDRLYIRENFDSCKKGKFDYCYPFIELSLKYLKRNGKLAYLIPTNIFKNVFARDLRQLLLKNVSKIFDYTTEKIFNNVLTSSSILICNKNLTMNSDIQYYDIRTSKMMYIKKDTLEDKWMFMNVKSRKEKALFSDYFLAATSVATLLNEAFVIKKYEEYDDHDDHIIVNNIKIEKEIIRKAASPRALSKGSCELIIFPYKYTKDGLQRIDEHTFIKMYAGATEHLTKFMDKLKLRKSDNISKWFEYGRSQALDKLNQKKLLLSFIVTNKVHVYEVDENTIPYSGIYIVPKANMALNEAKEILESEEFLEYVRKIGIYVNGSSLRITANDIKNYDIHDWRK